MHRMAHRRKYPRPSKRNFSERFYPARPHHLLKRARALSVRQMTRTPKIGLPLASNVAYIRWLKGQSMLATAIKQARTYSGQGRMWQNPFARPRPRAVIAKASVWYTAYPISMIARKGDTMIGALANEGLWDAFREIGITGLHTGPMKRAGGIDGWRMTPSIDGHFDRISNRIDPVFGSETEFRRLAQVAASHDGIIIDDIVPGHTGKGADFRLAEMGYKDYPGIYHMVEINPADWHLLPDVPRGRDSVNISAETEENLKRAGYIIGKLHRVIFYEPGVKETNWSVTRKVRGVDGVMRRWVYLHYFKDGQPSINWLDPSFNGMKLVIGDAMHSLGDLGSSALRLDANGFLGIEKSAEDAPAWSEGHPLSEAANHLIASMVRKFGGFTFQELNLSIDDIKTMSTDGADLSYDFITRPAYQHALATGDTEFLRLMMREALSMGVDPASLVHALQNHDELTFELVHFWTVHKDDIYHFRGSEMTGLELRELIRNDLRRVLTEGKPYNLPFTDNGIACTTVSVIAASLGITDVSNLTADQKEQIKQAHILLAMFNALQPGVFALSGWDLSGSLTLQPDQVKTLMGDGDTRWINRGAYDLMDNNPEATMSSSGMPRSVNLYGSLPDQLKDDQSFARRLERILRVREQYGIALGKQLDIPAVSHPGLLVMVHELPQHGKQVTVLNFSDESIERSIISKQLPPDAQVVDMFTDEVIASVDGLHSFSIALPPYHGTSLLIR